MGEKATDAMQQFGDPGPGSTDAGLVLLYAEDYTSLPPGWSLLRSGPTRVGSSAEADLVLEAPAVSRVHAELRRDGGGYRVTDLESTNGTYLDGYRVASSHLEHGQELRIGDAIVKFVQKDASRYRDYRLDGQMQPPARRLASTDTPLLGGFQMDTVAAEIETISESPLSLSVLLLGESGTGKEVVAQELHRRSGRRGPFRAINCAALPGNLIESELFGYKKGAFSGADRDKPGLIRTAHRGTLLLDEIGDMPLEAQAKLLRVLQSRELFPLGATEPEKVDVRVIGATHRNLGERMEAGQFRADLYARLNDYRLALPPLRERKEDVFLLLREFFKRHGRPELSVSFPFMTALLHYDWPLNVRELESCAKRCVALCRDGMVGESLLPDDVGLAMKGYGRPQLEQPRPSGSSRPASPSGPELEAMLKRHRGNVAAVARELGKARMQIHRWIKRHEIDLSQFRPDE